MASPTRSRVAATCATIALVVVAAGVALFHSPAPIARGVRLIGQDLALHGGYATWRVALGCVIVFGLALWAGYRRAPLAAAWTAAIAAGAVSLIVAGLNPGMDDGRTATIGAVIGATAGGVTFMAMATVGTVFELLLDRRSRRPSTP